MVDQAQSGEDVELLRCFTYFLEEPGFYIDVGAKDPEIGSFTRSFYDHGWRGLNVEPSAAWSARLRRDRSRDINIQATVIDDPDRTTSDAVTLTQICERHAPKQIHFLKVDAAGHEDAILSGMDFTRFRPWLLVITAHEPDGVDIAPDAVWDQLVRESGYTLAYTNTSSRYYVAGEHPELLGALVLSADGHVRARELRRIATLEAQLLRVSS